LIFRGRRFECLGLRPRASSDGHISEREESRKTLDCTCWLGLGLQRQFHLCAWLVLARVISFEELCGSLGAMGH
jgi:hypothetical protein